MKHTITRRNKQSRNGSHKRSRKGHKRSHKRSSKGHKRSRNESHKRSRNGHKRSHKRSSKGSHKRSRKNNSIKKGGGIGNGVLANPPALGSNVTAAYERMQASQQAQADLIKQNGGSVSCCDENNVYGYPCPSGMCGPIPQTSNPVTNELIRQAAVITATGLANGENDSKVSNAYFERPAK